MKRYFLIEPDYDNYNKYTDEIIYDENRSIDIFFENIETLYNLKTNSDIGTDEMFVQYLKSKNISDEVWEEIKEGRIDSSRIFDRYEQAKADYASFFGIDYGTVGYSNWTNYWSIASDRQLVEDLWEGNCLYYVAEIDKDFNVKHGLAGCYLPSQVDLETLLDDEFGVEEKEIVLIDNEVSRYMNFPIAKVEITRKVGEIIDR